MHVRGVGLCKMSTYTSRLHKNQRESSFPIHFRRFCLCCTLLRQIIFQLMAVIINHNKKKTVCLLFVSSEQMERSEYFCNFVVKYIVYLYARARKICPHHCEWNGLAVPHVWFFHYSCANFIVQVLIMRFVFINVKFSNTFQVFFRFQEHLWKTVNKFAWVFILQKKN